MSDEAKAAPWYIDNGYHQDFTEIRGALKAATKSRRLRDGFVDGELAWVTYERNTVHNVVNALRARRQKSPVPEERVLRAERSASGHVDYVVKYALGAADIVHDQDRWEPHPARNKDKGQGE